MFRFFPFLSVLLFLAASPRLALGETIYRDELLNRARSLGLATSPAWTKLLHFETGWLSPFGKSSIDDPGFFISSYGKSDPEAELEADLNELFEPRERGMAFACRFPARYHLLKSFLQIEETRLPSFSCPEFEEWERSINAHSVTIVYPAAYLNNPASMFGHTLLRFDAEDQTESTRLLAYGASYAASTTETSGFVFAFRGIFGFYKGSFSISPYYKLVRDYSEIENRDIWEYQLSLSPEEVQQVVRHLWEVGNHWLDYYFFDENCSYELLVLLEAAVPRLNLAEHFSLWVLPPETLRVLSAIPGLIRGTHFRAAKSTLVREEERLLSYEEVALAKNLALGLRDISAVRVQEEKMVQARVLELSYDYLEYLQNIGKRGGEDPGKRARELLLERNALGVNSPNTVVPSPKVRPEQGHRGGKLGSFFGADQNGGFGEFRFRPAFHELIDPEEGYARGGELRFFDTRLRYQRDSGLQVQSFTPLAIQSFTPRTQLFTPISWKVEGSFERYRSLRATGDFVSSRFELGAGLTHERDASFLIYEILDARMRHSDELPGDFAFHLGPEMGLMKDFNENLRLKADLKYLIQAEELRQNDALLELQARYTLSPSVTLQFAASRASLMGYWRNQFEAGFSYFF